MFNKKDEPIDIDLNILNDIYLEEENKDVDISSLFLVKKTWVLQKLFKHSTLDLKNKIKKSVFLSINPKIKILKLYKPFNNEIKKIKKNKPIVLSNYFPKKDKDTLDIENIDNWKITEFFDIKHPLKPNFYFIFFKNYKKSILKTTLWFLALSITLLWYWIITKSYIENTFTNIQKIDFSNINSLNKEVKSIKSDLNIANILIKPLLVINYLVKNSSIENLGYVINWTLDIINFWSNWLEIYDWLNKIILEKWVDNIMFSQFIVNIEPILYDMSKKIDSSISNFSKVKTFSSQDLDDKFNNYFNKLKKLNTFYDKIFSNLNNIKDILWHNEKKTYFVIFQNNDEIRPTWWFMWSIWIVDVFRGQVINFENKDIYAIEWDLKDFASKAWVAFEEPAPPWLNKITPTFWLRDANYFSSIKESSLEIKRFLDKSPKYHIDWIVYINQNLITNILKKTWPIYFDQVKRDIDENNFSMIFSTLVEAKLTKTHTLSTPKQILFDFSEIFLDKLKSINDYSFFAKLFLESIEKKDVLVYLFDENQNQFLTNMWLEKSYNYNDYLDFNYPVFTSISWNKSDRYISRTFEKRLNIINNCDVETSFNIRQKHNFNINEEVSIKNLLYNMNLLWEVDVNNLLDIQWRWLNKQFIRVLIPKNAIISNDSRYIVKDFENYKEVSFYLNTNSLFESNFSFNYNLSNPMCKNYNYLFIKQPWINSYNLDLYKNWNLENSLYNETDFTYNN